MGVVTVVDAEKTLAIEAASVTGGYIDGSSHLILVTHGGVEIDAGLVGGGSSTPADASTTVKGIVELATDTETIAGTDSGRAVTPFSLAALTATDTRKGLVELATSTEASTGTATDRAITPAALKAITDLLAPLASPALTGNPTAPTQTAGNNSTRIATTAFVTAAVAAGGGGGTSTVYNVKASGAVKGDGTTDDTTALNAVLAAAPAGSTVYFPPGTYLISAPIVYKSGCQYVGGGYALTGGGGNAAVIKLKNATNLTNAAGLTGIFVPDVWSSNTTLSGAPVIIENIAIDGNRANNTTSTACGIILMNYWSEIRNCYIYDTPNHGIQLTDVGANGTSVITNSASENRILSCKITGPKGNGINQDNNNAGANLDGFIEDCTIVDTVGAGISFDRSPGWLFRGNHLYGIGTYAIEAGFTFATRIVENYIEDFGNANVASTWYWAIGINQLNDRGSHILNNTISCAEPNAVTTTNYYYIRVNAATSQTTSRAVVMGNLIYGANRSLGVGIVTEGTGTLVAVVNNNQVSNVVKPYDIGGSATTLDKSDIAPLGAPTIAAGAQGSAASITSGSNNRSGSFSMTSKSASLAAGVLGTITFSPAYSIAPKAVILSPTNGAAAAAPIYATVSATAITVSTNAALTASTAYTFAYTLVF